MNEFKAPIKPFNTNISTPFDNPKVKGSLKYRIGKSDVFIMYGSPAYYEDFIKKDRLLFRQIRIVRKLRLPVILLIDTNLDISKRVELKIIVGRLGINVMKEIKFDFLNLNKKKEIEKLLYKVIEEMIGDTSHPFRWF